MSEETPLVAILMGQRQRRPRPGALRRGPPPVRHALRTARPLRSPDARRRAAFVRGAEERGVEVVIAAAGMAAHLAGACAAQTTLPVIGVPVASGPLNGQDALLSTVMMPPGMPVATVAINGAANAGHLAAQILSLSRPELKDQAEADAARRCGRRSSSRTRRFEGKPERNRKSESESERVKASGSTFVQFRTPNFRFSGIPMRMISTADGQLAPRGPRPSAQRAGGGVAHGDGVRRRGARSAPTRVDGFTR